VFLLDWTVVGFSAVASRIIGYLSNRIISYLSTFRWIQPQVPIFFACFDPRERLGFRDMLILICCPVHQRKEVKEELEEAGLTPSEATSRRCMIPGHDKAFVFVSGGIDFASSEERGRFCLRLVQIYHKGKRFTTVFSKVILRRDVLVSAASSLRDVHEMS